MRRLLVPLVCVLLFTSAARQVDARYDCRVTGVTNQSSCCCRGEAGRTPATSGCASTDAEESCGCCTVKVHDDTVKVTKGHAPYSELRTTPADAPPPAVFSAALGPTRAPGRSILRDDNPEPRSVGPGCHILFCSFLC